MSIFPQGEIAPARRDYDLFAGYIRPPARNGRATGRAVLDNPDDVLWRNSKGRGIRLYEDLERDPHLFACLSSRKLAVVGQGWRVVPASQESADREVADFCRETLSRTNLREAVAALLDATLKGFAVCELMWGLDGGKVRLAEFRPRAQHRFMFDEDGAPLLLTPENPTYGEPLPERKFVVFSQGSKTGSPYGLGLGSKLYWPVWFKKHGLKYWMVFAERFGSPTVVGKYPPGASPEQQAALLEAVAAIQQETGIKIPDTMNIELLEAVRSSTVNTYSELLAFMNAEISKVVLGQTLTTQEGASGSYALGKVHAEVRGDIIRADAQALAESLSRGPLTWLTQFNFPGRPAPRFEFMPEQGQAMLDAAERDRVIIRDLGLPVSAGYLYAKYDIPKPAEGEALVSQAAGQEGVIAK
jgi:phage gp29-like protein